MTQQITREVDIWVRTQLKAGHSHGSLLDALTSSGWERNMAMQVLDQVASSDELAAAASPVADETDEPEAAPQIPWIDIEGSPLYLDAGDRRVTVLGTMKHPTVVMLGGLLSDEECDGLMDAARPRMQRSGVIDMATGNTKIDEVRTSNGMFFQRGESELLTRIEERIARLIHWPASHGEGIQVLQYGPGAQYRPHYDYFDPREPGTPTIVKRGGQRVATVVMYLHEPARGGGTSFPDVGFEAYPKRGNAVFFSYVKPHHSTKTLHGGSPVLEGEKWIATKWLREREFEPRSKQDTAQPA